MIDSTVPETTTTTVDQAETSLKSRHHEQLTAWLIVLASLILVFLVYKIVMIELEVHGLLDHMLVYTVEEAPSKS